MPPPTDPAAFGVETIELDLPALAGAFSQRLRHAGLPMTAERAASFADALALVKPISRRRLYWTARAVFVSDSAHVKAFDAVFGSVFGGPRAREDPQLESDEARTVPAPPDDRPHSNRETGWPGAESAPSLDAATADASGELEDYDRDELLVPTSPSAEEVLREKRFDALEPRELAQLYQLMTRLEVATPLRRTRRAQRWHHGQQIDLRGTLRGSLRTGGDPIRLRRRRRRVVRRRLVLLCDISGSMEPYARAYLQFLTCAAGSGYGHPPRGNEAFAFATRLTRLTRA
ncbi:MAG: VWA domain-containing protein, partial [Actinomycetota bacterium]|nr:VWA domain-containing protein [Actinomycetota bacterium]